MVRKIGLGGSENRTCCVAGAGRNPSFQKIKSENHTRLSEQQGIPLCWLALIMAATPFARCPADGVGQKSKLGWDALKSQIAKAVELTVDYETFLGQEYI